MWSWIRLLQGCANLSAPDELYIEGEPVERVSVPAFGGSVAANEAWVAASDVDGDKIIFRSEGSETHQLVLPSGWAPGPLLFGRDGVVHVLLRGTGSLLSVDPGLVPDGFAGPSLEDLRPVCEAPRGIGLDPRDGRVWVACAGGELVGMGAGEDQIRYLLDSDLRDVVPLPDGRALVSRLREAEVLLVDLDSGQLEQRFSPNTVFSDGQTLIPRVARRMIPYRDKALLLFQAHQQEEVDERVGYNGIVTDVVVEVGPHGISDPVNTSQGLMLDLVPYREGILHLGSEPFQSDTYESALTNATRESFSPRLDSSYQWLSRTLATSVAIGPNGEPWVATRDPFTLQPAINGETYLSAPTDEGLLLFHRAPSDLACASCHPEGMDDGHTWSFVGAGPRRTQALGGGILESAPFHWDGALEDMDALYTEVGMGRMHQPEATAEQIDVLSAWMDALPTAPRGLPGEAAQIELGQALFSSDELGCTSCHAPPRYTSPGSYDVGTGLSLQVPSLLGVGQRLPIMHDGCAETLSARFVSQGCGGGEAHGHTSELTGEEIDALTAFLASL